MSYQALEGFRLSTQQEHLWRLQGDGPSGVTQSVLRISGALAPGRPRQLLKRLTGRHEMLRTVFRCLEGMELPIQVILDELELAYRELELPGGETFARLAAVTAEERSAEFDFDNGPVVRFALVTLGPDEHALVITASAVSADLASHRNLAHELARLLTADAVVEEPEEAEVTQYVDFAEWQSELLGGDQAESAHQYWRSQVTAEMLAAALPIERLPTAVSFPSERVKTSLPPAVVAEVEQASAELGVDVAAFLRAAWAVLLQRYLGTPQMVLGVAHDGRKYGELASALGPFGKTLPLVVELERDRPFARVAQSLARSLEKVEEWEEYFSFEVLPEQPDGRPSVLPFCFEIARPAEVIEAGELRLIFEPGETFAACARLVLRATLDEGIGLELGYDPDNVAATDGERLLDQLCTLLRSAARGGERAVADLDLLSATERRQLSETESEERPATAERAIHLRIEEQAERTPDAVAVVFEGAALSFGELERRAEGLARALERRGVTLESRVALMLPRSLEQIVAVLAVLRAGAAFVPIDPAQPHDRLLAMLQEVWAGGPRGLLLTGVNQIDELTAAGLPALAIEPLVAAAVESRRESDGARSRIPPESLAYLLFTSGSTGRPKGTMIRQRSVSNLANALEERIYLGRKDIGRVSLNAPLSFDAAVKQLVQLAWGRTLVIVPEETRGDGEALLNLLHRERVEALDCTPSQLGLLLAAGLDEQPALSSKAPSSKAPSSKAPSLKIVLIGGEAISPELWRRLAAHHAVEYHNVYGPTECTVDATACRIVDDSLEPTLGPAIANVGVFVVDARLHPVPLGLPGELTIAGAGLARGYVGRPGWTAERFVPDPFVRAAGATPGSRLYRSGDRVCRTPEDRLAYLGRIDLQVKLRGYRIELGEIESALESHPAVADAVATVREDQPGDPRLVAYVVPRRRILASIDAPTFRLPNGLTVAHRNRNETDYLYQEIFIDRCYARHGIVLPEGACVFDVGANIGMFSLFVLQECQRPRIYAFEPLPPLFETLKLNRDLHGSEVRLFPFGLSDTERSERFSFYPRYTMMSGQRGYARPENEIEVIKRFLENQLASGDDEAAVLVEEAEELLEGRFEAQVVEARLRRLSDVFREEGVEHVDLLKIDVQRAELDVLRGIDAADWGKIDQVVMELHDDPESESAGRVGQVTQLLEDLGFGVVAEQDDLLQATDRYNLYAVRRGLEIQASPPPVPSEEALDLDQLRDHLRTRLPEPMLPAAIVTLSRVPLTRHGKVDRAALPAPGQGEGSDEATGRPPRTPFEEVLAGIWSEVLGVERVGVEDSFFELGGHSILATRLMARVRQVFAIDLPLRVLFEKPTVESLAERVEVALKVGEVDTAPPLEPAPRDQALPLSFAQQRLWFLHQLEPSSSAYNNPKAIRFAGHLDADVLRRALDEVVRRHEVLRTTFPAVDGEAVQRIGPPEPLPLPRIDLRRLEPTAATAESRRLAVREGGRPFDLASERPLRITLVELADDDSLVLFTLHHIASDAWSLGLLTRELGEIYRAFRAGQPSPLAELSLQYADFAAWQRRWLQGDVLAAQLDYWRRQLAGLPAFLDLPTDRPRQAAGDRRGSHVTVALPADLVASLGQLARDRGATLFMVLLAGFMALLSRRSSVSDLAVGTPVAGRRQVELEGLIGLFLNTLVLRGDLRDRPSFEALVDGAREVTLGAFAHQDLPFETLVDALRPRRSLHHSPLFQVLFSLQNVPEADIDLPGVEVSGAEAQEAPARFDLTVILAARGAGLVAGFQYAAELFDPTTIARLAAAYQRLLTGLTQHPERPITEPSLLSIAEHSQLVTEWNDTGASAVPPTGLHQLLEAQAVRTPEAVAVVSPAAGQLSYRVLDAAADRFAGYLRELGAGPEVVVAVALERTPDLLVTLLGILKSGAAYLPLDPSYPPARLAFQLADAKAALLVTERSSIDRFPAPLPPTVFVDRNRFADDGLGAPVAATPLTATPVTASRQAYVIYTSGSTGRPKGVVVSHGAAVNFLRSMADRPGLDPADILAAVTTLAFDISILEIFLPLAVGARVVVVDRDVAADGALLAGTLDDHRITVMQATPATWRQLVESGWRGDGRLRVLCGGEPLPGPLAQRLLEAGGALWNLYGPTETTVWSAIGRLTAGPGPVTVGRPIARTRALLLDREMRPVSMGTPGEVFIGGAGLARGYLRRPGLSAERFVPDAASRRPGARLYRVGDLGRQLANGELEILGRVDHQVKVRGFRIEPGEIESALGSHPAVVESVVVARTDPGQGDALGGARLVAYVSLRDAPTAAVADLRGFLGQQLPAHMQPSAFVVLDALPRLPNGKIDRGKLPAPSSTLVTGAGSAPPRTPTEEILVGIWAEILGLDSVGIHDDFFELGGHSLLATRAVARVRRSLEVDVPLRALFEAPTVAGLADILAGSSQAAGSGSPLASGDRPKVIPLSFSQERLWFFEQLAPDSNTYILPTALRFTGVLDAVALQRAFVAITRRHEVLRTTYPAPSGEPHQAIAESTALALPVVDLAGLSDGSRQGEELRLAEGEAARPFDLERGPVLRLTLLRLAADQHTLLATLHHIAGDAWSIELLHKEVAMLYRASIAGESSALPELPVQYADFAIWQRHRLSGERLEAELTHWRDRLAGSRASLALPIDRPRPAVLGFRGATRRIELGAASAAKLTSLAQREGATVFMAGLAVFQIFLARHTGDRDVTVGSPVAGRGRFELEPLIGFFVNTVVLRLRLADDAGLAALVRGARRVALDAYSHAELPFEKLVEALDPQRSLDRDPLYEVAFGVRHAGGAALGRGDLGLPGLEVERLPTRSRIAKLPFSLWLDQGDDGLRATFEYKTDLFDATTVGRFADHFRNLLAAAVEEPDRPASSLPVLSPSERHQTLLAWNDRGQDVGESAGGTVLDLVAEQVARTPEATAVVQGEHHLSYGWLAAAAERVARRLRGHGVTAGVPVAVCALRAPQQVIVVLGVLRAGGVYVPLDPAYPTARRVVVLADSGAPLLIAQPELAAEMTGTDARLLPLDELCADGGESAELIVAGPVPVPGSGDLAYLIYTSGSTGRPKGVLISHRTLREPLLWRQRRYPLGVDDAVLQGMALGFDPSISEIFGALIAGARLVLPSPGEDLDPRRLNRLLGRQRVTILQRPLPLLRELLEQTGLSDGRTLRWLLVGGEILDRKLQQAFFAASPAALENLYGPTEAPFDVTLWSCVRGEEIGRERASVPIGRPVAGKRVWLLDRAFEPAAIGVVGELAVGGELLAAGYHRHPARTAVSFVPDPWAGRSGARLYLTGDLARTLGDGEVEFLGRFDHQVKLQGLRVELGEIESLLAEHPAVAEAAVALQQTAGRRRLVAFLVPRLDTVQPPEASELRRFLGDRLPTAMIPTAYGILERLPLSVHGKLDRRALPVLAETAEARQIEPPRSGVEEALVSIWADLLDREEVGIREDFFALGGHSLLAARVVSRVRDVFRIELPLRALFEAPTVAALAARVESEVEADHGLRVPALERRSLPGAAPLSFGQQRLWFLNRLEPESAAYHLPLALRIVGGLEAGALVAACAGIERRHEILRTTFVKAGDDPVQRIAPPSSPLAIVDLAGLGPATALAAAEQLAVVAARRPFDLERDRPFRAVLLRLDDDDHVFSMTLHHIASDGWSMGNLARELGVLYEAACRRTAAPLAELPVQYSDFAVWQRSWLRGDLLAAEIAFWRRRLAGLPPFLDLPTDRPRPVLQTFTGRSLSFLLPAAQRQRLLAFAGAEGATLFMTLLAAFQFLLGRYARQEDVAIGTPVAGRDRPELEPMIGFFVNTLVLRAVLEGRPSLRQLVQQVRETALDAYAHASLPFEKLVEEIETDRSLSHSPLFQVMFVLQNVPLPEIGLGDIEVQSFGSPSEIAKFDLMLSFSERDGMLAGALEYNTDLFDETTIARFAHHFGILIERALEAPENPLSTLPLSTPAERQQLLREWNDTASGLNLEDTTHQLIAARCVRTPDAIAAICTDHYLSYRELDRRVARGASFLRGQRLGPGAVIGVLAPRDLEFLVSMLALFKAGMVYLPLDPTHPAPRLHQVLAQSGAAAVLVADEVAGLFEEAASGLATSARPQVISRSDLAAWSGVDGDLDLDSGPRDLAYVIFTSGSTGVPKGAMLEHRGMLNHLFAKIEDLAIDDTDCVAQTASQSFDISVWQFLVTLVVGGRVLILGDDVALVPERLIDEVERHRVTLLETVPSLMRLLLEELSEELSEKSGGSSRLAALRWLIPTGEALPPDLARDWLARYREIPLVNAYGPTECSDDVTHFTLRRPPAAAALQVPIGRPLRNLQMYSLDSELRPVPLGVVGALHVGGVGVGRGYLDERRRTARVFVPDPFGGYPGQRLYATGDLGRCRRDGEIEYRGRVDHQVKIHGVRIELGEIEAALAALEPVGQAVARLSTGEAGDDSRLVAYVVPAEGAEIDASVLRRDLVGVLPEPMVPGAFIVLAALPLTPNGKIDRRALPVPEAADFVSASAEGNAPRDPVEELVANIWSNLLNVERIGVHQSFFELGGHSLLATRVISRLRAALGVELKLRDLFLQPTVAGVAEIVRELLNTRRGPSAPAIERVRRDRPLPLSFAQQRMWFLDQLQPGSAVYNIPMAFEMRGRLDVGAFGYALGELTRRHEILRTSYGSEAGRPVQVVSPEPSIALPVIELGALRLDDRRVESRRLVRMEASRPFDLAQGPVVRVGLVRVREEESVLWWTLHHIAGDGWSLGIVVRELAELYRAACRGESPSLQELSVQYADFAVWQRSWLSGEVLESEMEHWRRQLAGVPEVLELPTDRPRPAIQRFRSANQRLALAAELSESLRRLSREHEVSLFMTLMAGLAAVFERHTGQADFCIGTPIAGRNRLETEELIGLFVNTLAVRCDVTGNPSFEVVLERTRKTVIEAHTHQDLPFEKLVDELQPERRLSHSPLFQVMFVLQNLPRADVDLEELEIRALNETTPLARFDIGLVLSEHGGEITGFLSYDADLFDGTTILRLAEHLRHLLAAAVAAPSMSVGELPVLGGAESQQLLLELNDTAKPYPTDSLLELFTGWAEGRPEAVALIEDDAVSGGRYLSYGELAARADRIAAFLAALGVTPEQRVGVCLERSAELVATFLGVLRAGGVYVPLDPTYPSERLSSMLEDAQAEVLLSDHSSAQGLAAPRLRRVDVDEVWSSSTAETCVARGRADQLGYMIFTSGSTGRPKASGVIHRGLANFLADMIPRFGLAPGQRFLNGASPSFDASVAEMALGLGSGATLCLAGAGGTLPGEELVSFLETRRVTGAALTPTVLEVLPAERVAALSLVITMGEACSDELVATWSPGRRMFNAYGPSEATICATCRELSRSADTTIGRPLQNVRTHVLDRRGAPLPMGVPGELHLSGVALSRGYVGRPELTALAFVPDPFVTTAGGRLYRTGDSCRWLGDGRLDFLGRIDHQVKVRGFRIELGEVEAAIDAQPEVRSSVVIVREDIPGTRRLVAYVVAEGENVSTSELRDRLRSTLPEQMLPSAVVRLPSMPLLPSGKVDRKALPEPPAASPQGDSAPPRSPREQILAKIWCETLGLEQVSVHDNFFDLGGDSILSIQIVSRAKAAGLALSARQLFEHQTIAALAAVAEEFAPTEEELGPVVGDVPLGAIQRWFFDSEPGAPHHFNQSVLVAAREPVEPAHLANAVTRLHEHHDALRARFELRESGWHQRFDEAVGEGIFLHVDLSHLGASAPRALELAARQVQEGFDLESGPLARWIFFDLGFGALPRLLIVIHHLVVDGVSWRILFEDLVACYRRLADGEEPGLPARTSSVKVWTERLAELAGSDELAQERPYWLDVAAGVSPLPVDDPRGENLRSSEAQVAVELDEAATLALLQKVPAAYRTQINDVLLTALVQVVCGWTGSSAILLRLETHGREELFSDVDLSRTVGWLTGQYPLRLSSEAGATPGATLKRVKETLRAVPRGGLGYGLLRYLAGDHALAEQPEGELTFNYLGQLGQVLPESSIFGPASESAGPQMATGERRPHRLGISAWIAAGRLRVGWSYSREQYRETTVRRLAEGYLEALRGLIDHCLAPEAGGLTPSDVPLAGVDQQRLDRVFASASNVEDVYRLSPIQLGFLLQAVEARDAGVYVEQMSGSMTGDLDLKMLERAWQAVVDRHSILRTRFLWEGLEQPVQAVDRRVPVGLRFERWHGLEPEEQAARLAELQRADREAGFDLTRPPLTRGTLIEVAPRSYRFVWTYHHLIGDGWSTPVLIGELLTIYRALVRGKAPDLPPARPFRDLVAWLDRQDPDKADAFWRSELRGFSVPTRVPVELAPSSASRVKRRFDDRSGRLTESDTGGIEALGRRLQVTLATLLEGAWAYVLGLYCDRDDVVFGVTVSGRPAELAGVESIVGPFINTVPSRVKLDGESTIESWLRDLQGRRIARQEIEHVAFEQGWSELPAGVPLFESLFVLESFPTAAARPEEESEAAVSDMEAHGAGSRVRTRYPLNLVIHPGRELSFYLSFDGARIEPIAVERILKHLGNVFASLGGDPSRRLSELSFLAPAERHQLTCEWGRPENWPPSQRAEIGEIVQRAVLSESTLSSEPTLIVLDRQNRPAPPGVAGELRYRLSDSARREEASEPTGEAARFHPDGTLELLGPLEEQMTIRGLTIFPRLIEAALEQHPKVAAAVVVGVAGQGAGQGADTVLVACVTVAGDRLPEAGELRRYADRELPAPWRPRSFVILDTLPLLSSGKADRETLREEAEAALEADETGGSALEEIVLGVWRDVLGLETLGREESFLDLGGHSLLAVQLLSRLRQALEVELALADLFEAPTVAALTPRIEAALALGDGSAPPAVERAPRGGDLPLSFAQQRLWFLDQLEPGNPSYNVAAPLRFGGALDLGVLERTLTEVVRRHEVLRTTFPARSGRPIQRIEPPRQVPVPHIDLRCLNAPSREAETRRLARREALRPFDLACGPLLRCVVLHLDSLEQVVLFTTHHIVSDAWSIEVLLREVGVLYQAFAAGLPSPLAALEVQYADYASWQRQWLRGEVLDGQLRYWRRHLGQDPPILVLPRDRPQSQRQGQLGAQQLLMLSDESSRGLVELGRSSGATLFMTLLAAFATLLSKVCGQEDFVVGMPVAHRPRLELESLIGFFINILPLRLAPAGKLTFHRFLEQVRERALGALAHQDLPLEKLVEMVSSSRQSDRSPLFSVTFGVQNTPQRSAEVPGMELEMLSFDQQTVRFELTVWARETANGIGLMWTHDAAVFEPATIREMHRKLERLIEKAVARPEATLEELRASGPGEMTRRGDGSEKRQLSLHKKLISAKPKGVKLPGGSAVDKNRTPKTEKTDDQRQPGDRSSSNSPATSEPTDV